MRKLIWVSIWSGWLNICNFLQCVLFGSLHFAKVPHSLLMNCQASAYKESGYKRCLYYLPHPAFTETSVSFHQNCHRCHYAVYDFPNYPRNLFIQLALRSGQRCIKWKLLQQQMHGLITRRRRSTVLRESSADAELIILCIAKSHMLAPRHKSKSY